jgi:hypothetical protein
MNVNDPVTHVGTRVNDLGQVMARAVVEQRASYISDIKAQAWTVVADDADVAAGEYIIWLKNTGTTPIGKPGR